MYTERQLVENVRDNTKNISDNVDTLNKLTQEVTELKKLLIQKDKELTRLRNDIRTLSKR